MITNPNSQSNPKRARTDCGPAVSECSDSEKPVLQVPTTYYADSLESLCVRHAGDHNLALWEREPLPEITREIKAFSATTFPDTRTDLVAGRVEATLIELIESQGFDARADFPVWLADMVNLAETFIDMVQCAPVVARIETLDGMTCPRFHVDNSYLRLVCTYRGPGTEWLDDAQVDRKAHAGGAPNEEIIRFGQPNRMQEFAVGLMKGRQYPDQEQLGLVHRSPLPDSASPARLLFCLECSSLY